MADTTSAPSATTEAFELPPTANVAAQNNKEVSWSGTPGKIDQATIEKLKKPVTYEIDAALAIKGVLKETYRQFKATDPNLLFVLSADPSMIICTVEDCDRIPLEAFPKF